MMIISKVKRGAQIIYNRALFALKKLKWADNLKVYGVLRLALSKNADLVIGHDVVIRSGWRENPAGGH